MITLTAAVVVWIGVSPANAVNAVASESEGFRYEVAVIQTLVLAKRGGEAEDDGLKEDGATDLQTASRMQARKLANMSYRAAASNLERFQKSPHALIAKTSSTARDIYLQIASLNDELNALNKKTLGGVMTKADYQDYADKITSLGAARKRTWENLSEAVAMTTYGLFKMPKDNNTPIGSTFAISRKERAKLLAQLKKEFDSADKPQTGERPVPEITAALLYKFISDKQWKTSQ